MFSRYIKLLDKIVEKFNNIDKILEFLKRNKWKILIFFFLVKGLQTMYMVYERGQCVNCDKVVTKEKIESLGGNREKLIEFSKQELIFVPYTDVKSYLLDTIIPLIFTLGTMFIGFSLIYILYRICIKLLKSFRLKISEKVKNKMEEELKKQQKKR